MRILVSLTLLSVAAITAAASNAPTHEAFISAKQSLNTRNRISMGITNLALDIDHILEKSQKEIQDSTLFSPTSIMTTLAMVMLGSGGATFTEFVRFLYRHAYGFDASRDTELYHQFLGQILNELNGTTKFAFGIFHQEAFPIRKEFQDASKKIYKSEMIGVNFQFHNIAAQKIINDWISQRTGGMIKDMLSSPPAYQTQLMITSALYFDGNWDQSFPQSDTKRRPFIVNGNETIQVDLMNIVEGSFPFYSDPKLRTMIIAFPYSSHDVSMYVLLPEETGTQGVKNLKSKLTPQLIENLIANMENTTCNVHFPKMQLSSSLKLDSAFKELGLESLFDPATADLSVLSPGRNGKTTSNKPDPSRITFPDQLDTIKSTSNRIKRQTQQINIEDFGIDKLRNSGGLANPKLHVDEVIHKVAMTVNEKGTKAAAATTMTVIPLMGSINTHFIVDRPFLLFIRHDPTKAILFWGTINRPTPYWRS